MKKVWLITVIALLCLAVAGGYAVLDAVFPKADKISCPNEDGITSISLTQSDGTSALVEALEYAQVLQNIRSAKPTRKMSVNDHPAAEAYYTVKVDTSAGEYRYFVYAENSQVYIEIPYEGIYITNWQFFDFVAAHFED